MTARALATPTRITSESSARAWLAAHDIAIPTTAHIVDGVTMIDVEWTCGRCIGAGRFSCFAHIESGTCFACRGDSRRVETMTLVKWAQREKAARARREKAVAAREATLARRREAKLTRQRDWCEEHGYGRVTFEERDAIVEAKRRAEAETSQFLGDVGDTLTVNVTIERTIVLDTEWGTATLYIFRDDAGNKITWQCSGRRLTFEIRRSGKWCQSPEDEPREFSEDGTVALEAGDRLQIRGRVRAHRVYRDERETVLTRARMLTHHVTLDDAIDRAALATDDADFDVNVVFIQ